VWIIILLNSNINSSNYYLENASNAKQGTAVQNAPLNYTSPVKPFSYNANLIAQTKPDTFEKAPSVAEIQPPKADIEPAKAKNKTKLIIGAVAAALTVAVGGILLHRKFNAEKLTEQVQKILPEHIDFSAAKTKDEAVKFGQNVLGIKNYVGFEESDIKVLNWINEGLVNVNNRTKGRAQMPGGVIFDLKGFNIDDLSLGENTLAAVNTDVSKISKKFARQYGESLMFVNTKFFRNPVEALNASVERSIKGGFLKRGENGLEVADCFVKDPAFLNLLERFQANSLDFNEQVLLSNTLSTYRATLTCIIGHPMKSAKSICESLKMDEAQKSKILEDLGKKSYDEQKNWMRKLIKDYFKKFKFVVKTEQSPFTTIYHEMGHLQDKVERPFASGKFKSPDAYPKELKEWLDNSNNMEVANMVSPYAGTGPGEFIAETFARIMNGTKIQPEVKELYTKLNGPSIAFS